MNDFKKSVMIALLPSEPTWCKIDLPHLTLVYAGEMSSLKPTVFNEMAKDASSIAMTSKSIVTRVVGVEIFGDEDPVQVLKVAKTSELLALRYFVERWNASKYDFNPHATIGPVGSYSNDAPEYIRFDRISVVWGEDQITFNLK